MKLLNLISIFIFFCSCERQVQPEIASSYWQTINSRDDGDPSSRYPLYRAKIPLNWKRIDPLSDESIVDTTKSLCEFLFEEGKIRITIHNFPIEPDQPRIPPIAQINRWRSQFESIDPAFTNLIAQSYGGFIGYFLDCEGLFKNEETRLLGWAMQLAPEYDQQIGHSISKEKRADYTIKVLGMPKMISRYREEIINFANSFELIEELNAHL